MHSEKPIHIGILGAGAIGCIWYSALVQAKKSCTLVLRNEASQQTLRDNGLHYHCLFDPSRDNTFSPQSLISNKHVSTSFDILLVCTKAKDSLTALQSNIQCIDDNTRIVLFQNGMGSQQQVAKSFPNNTVACVVTSEGAYLNQSFDVVHAGRGQTYIGLLQCQRAKTQQSQLELIQKTLKNEWIHFEICDDILIHLWNKLAINACINGYTAIYQCNNGELESNPEIAQRVSLCCKEIAHLYKKLDLGLSEKKIYDKVIEVIRNTANNRSSMLQDIQQAKATEIDFINAYIVMQAKQHELPHEENLAIWQAVKNIEAQFKKDN